MAVHVVQVVDEFGSVESEFNVPPTAKCFPGYDEDLEGFTVLADIDPWGDTILNGLQTRRFIAAWDRWLSTLTGEPSLQAGAAIRTMAETVIAEEHTYLEFEGD